MKLIFVLLISLQVCGILGCGVKGDPLIPLKPTPLGRGRPTYKKAVEEFATPNLPPVIKRKDEDEDDERER